MLATSLQPLPFAVGIAILALAALSQALARRVPNVVTLPAVVAAWVYAIYVDATRQAGLPTHAFLASLLGTFLALIIMLPVYRTKRLGAGCVKAQMAFAAWTCVAIPLVPALAMTVCATIGGLAFTFVLFHLTVADIPDERRSNYAFPAQVTMAVVAVVGAIACWISLYLA